MSVRSIVVCLIIHAALSGTAAWAAGRAAAPAASIELSEPASSPAAEGLSDSLATAAPVNEAAVVPEDAVVPEETGEADPGQEPATAAKAPGAAAAAAGAAALQPSAPGPEAGATPAAPAPVSWWREAASFLGLAPDPHPGEVAEPAPGRPRLAPDYIIGAGDLLGISVWRDENLTRAVVVLPDGKIAFPLVGDLVAGGKTVAQLKEELEKKLARYVTDSGLTVEVKQSNSMIIYIIGRVNSPGRQMMVATTNVLQGLAMAGGLNQFARRGAVKVFRKQEGKTSVFSFNYDDVAEGRHLESNIDLQKGDVILVP